LGIKVASTQNGHESCDQGEQHGGQHSHGFEVPVPRRAEFARRFALDPRALQDWEQGRRPDRAARAYLTVIARHPEAVVEALAS
jgi:hypothetical protein